MADFGADRWNERYGKDEYAYGTDPNDYFKQQLDRLPAGKILLPADGEARNGVYAATQGWEVFAFDISSEAKRKAELLAEASQVTLDYQVGDLPDLHYPPESFDAIALIYAHFPAPIKSARHRMLDALLKPGGWIIFEAFSKSHLAYVARDERVGGPKDLDTLFSIAELQADFPQYEYLELLETEVTLSEGQFHNGTGSVIRFLGRKR